MAHPVMFRLQKIVAAAVGMAGVLILAVALFDWNMLRGYVERAVTERSGRPCSIGYLDVDVSLHPRVHVRDLKLGNADWGSEPWMLDIPGADFTVALWPLVRGEVVFGDVGLTQPLVVLEKSRDGRRNWILKRQQTPRDTAPVIRRLTVDRGTLIFRDPAIDTDVTVHVSSDSAAADPRQAVHFAARGKIKSLKSAARGTGGAVLSLRDKTLPYPLRAEVDIGDTHLSVDGTVAGLALLSPLDFAFQLRGADLAKLYALSGIALPSTPPYRLDGRLVRNEAVWELRHFTGRVGDSDLSGNARVDTSGVRPVLAADMTSRVLDIDDLAGFIGAPPQTGPGETASAEQKKEAAELAGRRHVLPDKKINLGKLRAMDADVKLKAKSIRRKKLPLDNLLAHLQLHDGLLTLDPLDFGVAGGTIISHVVLDARNTTPSAAARLDFNRLRLDRLVPNSKLMKESIGTISGRASLKGEGGSFAQLLGSADGHVATVVAGGKVSNLLLEFAGIDGGEIIKFLLEGDREVRLRCAVADFDVKNGLMSSKALVFDTTDTNIGGEGTVNLKDETLNLTLVPLPKDKSILSARVPLHVAGSFKHPRFAPDKPKLAARAGGALLLGLINPLAALIPLIETGPGKDSDCKGLIAMATRDAGRPPEKN